MEIYALSIDDVCLYLYAKSFKDIDSQTLKDFKDPGEPCVIMNWDFTVCSGQTPPCNSRNNNLQ